MRRCVVSVADTTSYQRGLRRLKAAVDAQGHADTRCWTSLPPGSPTHEAVPYAFKAVALKLASDEGFDTLLWADACILPIRDMTPLWERIEAEGYWVARNGWMSSDWCADSAYPALFPEFSCANGGYDLEAARAVNSTFPHVVATSFGLSLRHDVGQKLLAEYYRLATETNAFCGPWWNTNSPTCPTHGHRCAPCGPATTLGHRHDQSALSVLVWRLGMTLTDCPAWFSYRGGERDDTYIVADGNY